MTAHTGQTLAADNAVVAGAVAHSAQTQNETIAMLLKFKAMSNELRKEVNANTVTLGVQQGNAEKDFYNNQANTDRIGGIMSITSGVAEIGVTAAARHYSDSDQIGGKDANGKELTLKDGISTERGKIDDCNEEGKRLRSEKSEAVLHNGNAARPAGANAVGAKGPARSDIDIEKDIATNNATKKDAEAALRSFEDRKSQNQRNYDGIIKGVSTTFDAASKLNSANNSEAQAKNKLDEMMAQTTNSMNQNVWKGFDTQNDTMASEITSTLQTYGQAMVQANTHFRG